MAGGLFSLAKLFGITIRESADDGSDFTNPDADYRRLFLGEDGALHLKDSSGTVTTIGGTGSTSFTGCRAYNSATQSISDSTPQAVTFNSENHDTSSIHSTSSNTSRFTASATGYWRFRAGTGWDTNTSGLRYLWWRVDGTTEVNGGAESVPTSAGTAPCGQTEVTLYLTTGQYVELMAYQTSGGARNIGGTSGDPKFETWCEAELAGA